jgi:ribosomal protein S18 acetylase RimI-like enzyme
MAENPNERDGMPNLSIREAREDDLPAIVALLAADVVGGHGDKTDEEALPDYATAFQRIAESPDNMLYVAEVGGEVIGTFQTTLITTLLGRGAAFMKVEAVHVWPGTRGKGVGSAMMRFAIEQARQAGARSVQLTSNKARHAAHLFYERLGFDETHFGFKLKLK